MIRPALISSNNDLLRWVSLRVQSSNVFPVVDASLMSSFICCVKDWVFVFFTSIIFISKISMSSRFGAYGVYILDMLQ